MQGESGNREVIAGIEQLQVGYLIVGVDTVVRYANPWVVAELGRGDIVGTAAEDLLHPDDFEIALRALDETMRGAQPGGTPEVRIRDAHGRYQVFEATVGSLMADGDLAAFSVLLSPVSDLEVYRRVMAGLLGDAAVEELLDTLVRLLRAKNDMMWSSITFRLDDEFVSVGDPLPEGLRGDDRTRWPWREAIATGDDVYVADLAALDDESRMAARSFNGGSLGVLPIPDPAAPGPATLTIWRETGAIDARLSTAALAVRELAELVLQWHQHTLEVAWSATHDGLTGLLNRQAISTALSEADERPMTFVAIDLDHFKPVNDQHGHDAGDTVLQEVAARIQSTVRRSDLVGRLGGDEFVVLCAQGPPEAVRAISGRILTEIARPISYDQMQLQVGASIGIAAGSARSGLALADAALYAAKRSGRGRVVFADETTDGPVPDRRRSTQSPTTTSP